MLAFEHSRRHQPFSFTSSIHSTFPDPYSSQNMNNYGSHDSTASFAPVSYSFFDGSSSANTETATSASLAMFLSSSNSSHNPSSPRSELLLPTLSNPSAASIPSNNSSVVGSPYSTHAQCGSNPEQWSSSNQGLALRPAIISPDSYDQHFGGLDLESEIPAGMADKLVEGSVDPALIQPISNPYNDAGLAYPAHSIYQPQAMFGPNPVAKSPNPSHPEQIYASRMYYPHYQQTPYLGRRASEVSLNSRQSRQSPSSADHDMEGQDKSRCTYPDCGRVFKDLKAHMLTHQSERPEKCPIANCEYNQKGFARKYDKNRHTLTHYKGTMVCGFCPGSGSSVEKSFNRADVFKRHLTSVHGVEQNPPNSRKRSPNGTPKKATSYCQDATGKCSTCSATFSNPQEFYEHLDDCVLRVVQQEEPSEAHNQRHLTDVVADEAVKATMERNMLASEDVTAASSADEDEEDDDDDDDDNDDDDEDDNEDEDEDEQEDDAASNNARFGKGTIRSAKATPVLRGVLHGGISKSTRPMRKGLTHSKGGVSLAGKGRRKRKHYPTSWGVSADKMKMKKRVLCVFDGERRIWKDDMMLNNEFEVRLNLADSKRYITDLDVEILNRAEALHDARKWEKSPWIEGNLTDCDLEELMS